jgi:hypothetical protein
MSFFKKRKSVYFKLQNFRPSFLKSMSIGYQICILSIRGRFITKKTQEKNTINDYFKLIFYFELFIISLNILEMYLWKRNCV